MAGAVSDGGRATVWRQCAIGRASSGSHSAAEIAGSRESVRMIVTLTLLPLVQAGLLPMGLSGGFAMVQAATPAFVAAFVSSCITGPTFLP
jgi:hypothetical protein